MDHKKYHEIQAQIQQAQSALQNWNDRRAEVAIELDSIFTDMEAYKTEAVAKQEAANATIAELREELVKADREFHKHFESFTNELQELKLDNENLSRQLKEALNEIESQNQSKEKMESRHATEIAKMAAEAEVRLADEQYQLKTQVNYLIAELQTLQGERKAITVKADQYENELRVIRTQMMSFLNVTKDVVAPEVTATSAVSAIAPNSANENAAINSSVEAPLNESNNRAAGATAANNNRKSNKLKNADLIVDNMGNTPTTVNDYLKRFGY